MPKILISWLAQENDFIKVKGKPIQINPDGPSSQVQNLFFNYDYHLLLTTASNPMEDIGFQNLKSHLKKTYKHKIVEKGMGIRQEDVINLEVISTKINELLLSNHRHDEIDIFISPGTPTMQVAWYLAYMNLGLNIKLFQLRRPIHTKSGMAEQIWVDFEKSNYLSSVVVKQSIQEDNNLRKNEFITSNLIPIYEKAKRIATSDKVRVLITGETGTGKELLARYIHEHSPRANKILVAINCSALNDQLLESRLFGYIKGAFTGAEKDTKGLFHEADGGTIFLDEIGDISSYMQQSLLRVLQSGEVIRVGSNKVEKVDVRIISATNMDLYSLSLEGKYRLDLYYRLSVIELKLPAIKEYPLEEKKKLFDFLWKKCRFEYNKKEPKLSKELKQILLNYPYLGNIREMENIIEGIIVESEDVVLKEFIPNRIYKPEIESSRLLEDIIYLYAKKIYELNNKNLSQTALDLDISINTLKSKLRLK